MSGPKIVTEQTWMTQAACRGMTGLFFPEKGQPTAEAKRVCAACPVRQECLQHAFDNVERYGVWGGKGERERRGLHERSLPPIKHGTDAGYKAHRRRGEPACSVCKFGHSQSTARRNAERVA